MSGKKKKIGLGARASRPPDSPAFADLCGRDARAPEYPGLANIYSGIERRRFLKLMGASIALAGLTGCRFPVEKIMPFAGRPEGYVPGEPVQYATSMELGGFASGLLATSFDGRPIKIDGNPLHPESGGASNAHQQASILELYDPDRSKYVTRKQGGREYKKTWDDFQAFAKPLFDGHRKNGGAGLRVLSEATSSPSVEYMRKQFAGAFPKAKWHEYEPVSRDNELEGARLAFGAPYRTHLELSKAKVIVCLDADILGSHPASLKYARDFAEGRTAENGEMSRLYVVESGYSITGAMADHRLAMPSSEIKQFPWALLQILFGVDFGLAVFPAYSAMVQDLTDHLGECVVVCGPRQPAEVHALVHLLNSFYLGHLGKTVWYSKEANPRIMSTESIPAFAEAADMRHEKIDTLLILGGNPVFNAPADFEFEKCLKNVKTAIHLSLYNDETSQACEWHLPRAHYLEAWGDGNSYDGTPCFTQPLIEPLYGGKSAIELLSLLLDDRPLAGNEIVLRTFGKDEKNWLKTLHDGVVVRRKNEIVPQNFNPWSLDRFKHKGTNLPDSKNLEIVFAPDASIYDGRFANNAWLQEFPDPITKITWDNAALISPATAKALDVENEDIIKITLDGRSIEIPVLILPGHADWSVTLNLGYGRTACGRVGKGVGTDVYKIRTSNAMDIALGAKIEKTGRKYKLATTQDHHSIRPIGDREIEKRFPMLVREADLAEYRKNPDFAKHRVHHPPLKSLWKEFDYTGHRWGMAIDLARCNGCGACVLACQAENNIPVVGKSEVLKGREMHWIRVDRYFSGEPDAPSVSFQPVPCQQCENAPCEQVCPVAATIHTREGLNDQVYNRCIGMRYCSQNCPFKVRRFNYFLYHKRMTDVEKMKFNPDVTVRPRGVMEKCTYCVQRIQKGKIAAKRGNRPIRDGEITPACAQACPARAIVFGDLSDPESRVSGRHARDRSYAMLGELNVKPRTLYLARIRNPAGKG